MQNSMISPLLSSVAEGMAAMSAGAVRQPMNWGTGPPIKHRNCFTKKGPPGSRLNKVRDRVHFWRSRYNDKRFYEILREQGIII